MSKLLLCTLLRQLRCFFQHMPLKIPDSHVKRSLTKCLARHSPKRSPQCDAFRHVRIPLIILPQPSISLFLPYSPVHLRFQKTV
ncbi:hypothetical protein LZ30DRAFT_695532 [Colletotrichum cereale]|nr:hypothetical protein LZ30DRAFT_695532 [Colletotrichum cereale]